MAKYTYLPTYSCYKRKKFPQSIQMQLYKKPKTFDQCFIAFLESISNFQHLGKKGEAHGSAISDIIDSEISCYLQVLKAIF